MDKTHIQEVSTMEAKTDKMKKIQLSSIERKN